jgi:hypothetical protein
VHGIGEVDRGRASGKGLDVSGRGEDEHLVLVEVQLEIGQELLGVFGLEEGADIADPGNVHRRGAFLVSPVSSDPRLGQAVHLGGADLHFERLSVRADHGGVEALIEVDLRHRHEILEAP